MTINVVKPIDRDTSIYLAGLFDGEGCVNICEREPRHGGPGSITPFFRSAISLTNTHHGVLLHIKTICGGALSAAKRQRVRKDGRLCKKQWRWSAGPRESVHILRHIVPFLIIKREQALLPIKFHKSNMKFNNLPHPGVVGKLRISQEEIERRREFVRRMQVLNHLGT